MPYTPIMATLGYVLSPDGQRVLLVHRNARPGDQHLGKYNGLGGKLEPNEDVVAGMRRELREEAQLEALDVSLRGTVSWPGFGKHGEDWFGFLFLIRRFAGQAPAQNEEGRLEWVAIAQLLAGELPIWPGDKLFLPLIFNDDPRQFHGVMPYHNGAPVGWGYSLL
ncbi:NUDIX hydrolase [Candidatus Viridilinea mediisalina]|uniref:7,8-dihydro-8-oxoguanine triphosphatase n=1 Tax=Candidatus Viridilinea mediisalina TaxID=2024553 RepID=A0A2A6RQ01_9CHLR|nr:8-oxo-dGTP diphosphatase [Candidatus Viridilinea mediisalina]PDW04981.1 7,8-dihydro-8-oxoguanine triphosphatase [Candidatus Viridilinea mediisalina]